MPVHEQETIMKTHSASLTALPVPAEKMPVGLIRKLWRAVKRRRQIARDLTALRTMDDRLLRDMGINRWDLR